MWRINYCCCSVASSCMTLCNHMDCSTRDSSFTISQGLLRLMSIESMMFCNHLILSPSCLLPSIFPSIRAFSNELLFASGGQSIGSSALVLPMNIQGWVPLGLTGLISLLSKGPLRVSEFESINSLAFSLLYGPILTFIHNYWKNHSFDYTDLCWQSSVSAF